FSYTTAFMGLNRLGTDAGGSLLVPAALANKLYLFRHGQLAGGQATIPATSASQIFAPVAAGYFGAAAALVDTDGDGLLDLIAGDGGQGRAYSLSRKTDGSFDAAGLAASWRNDVNGFSNFLAAGDLSGDSRPDLVVGDSTSGTGYSWVFWSSPTGMTDPSVKSILQGPGGFGTNLIVSDVNGDSKLDMVVGDQNGNGTIQIRY
ncbi:MAG: VCBS repeat-containing protein, partial [Deltaproteobacteria bacterium]|nr:VCBS repeat-containing protein [Deltaproteobacteria bacterium]